jgi:hypothetical protein
MDDNGGIRGAATAKWERQMEDYQTCRSISTPSPFENGALYHLIEKLHVSLAEIYQRLPMVTNHDEFEG